MSLTDLPAEILDHITSGDIPPMIILSHVCRDLTPMHQPRAPGHVCGAIAATGDTKLLDWAVSAGYVLVPRNVAASAAAHGHPGVLAWLVNAGCDLGHRAEDISIIAAENGHINILEYMHQPQCQESGGVHTYNCPMEVSEAAARGGHLSVIKWFVTHDYFVRKYVVSDAVHYGHVDMVEWLLDNGWATMFATRCTINDAVLGGHVEMCKMLHGRGAVIDDNAIKTAMSEGNVDILTWISEFVDLTTPKYIQMGD